MHVGGEVKRALRGIAVGSVLEPRSIADSRRGRLICPLYPGLQPRLVTAHSWLRDDQPLPSTACRLSPHAMPPRDAAP